MNPRQKKFCKLYLSGVPACRAYEQAGYKTTGNSSKAAAARMLTFVEVIDHIRDMNDKADDETIASVRERKQTFTEILRGESNHPAPQDAIRAGQELNKMDGAYAPKQLEHKVDSFFENVPEENGLG